MTSLPLADLLKDVPFRNSITCPNCWFSFSPEAALWISVNPKLVGEPQLAAGLLGGAEQKRFIAERFDVEGRAIDAEGAPCTQLACPRCKLLVPRAAFELPSLVLSVLGAPGSGKSVFLASLTFSMRQQASELGLRFQDADLSLNKLLLQDEQRMFLDPGAEQYRPINKTVDKTFEADDKRYRTSLIDGHEAKFVPPFTFLLTPGPQHPYAKEKNRLSRLLCLYDNAGEHFLPGSDSSDRPMTRHLAASKGLIYTFDPTRDRRVQRKLGTPSGDPGLGRQDAILLEAANRIREHAGISPTARIPQPLMIALTKFDVWKPLLSNFDEKSPLRDCPDTQIKALSIDRVVSISQMCRSVLWEYCREFVTAAESISDDVTYAPVAAVGWDVHVDPDSGLQKFRSADCTPFGVLVPLLWLLSKNAPRLCLSVKRRQD